MNLRMTLTAVLTVAAMVGTCAAQADGVCVKGYRDTTPAERATIARVLETVKRALPGPPNGWVILGDDAISPTTNLCADYELTPWEYDFSRQYQRVDDQEARDAIIASAAAAMQADQAKKQPRIDVLNAKIAALTNDLVAAAQASDFAKGEVINHQIDALSAEVEKIMNEGDPAARMNAAAKEASRDLRMGVVVKVNPTESSPSEDAKPIAAPAGAASAHRWSSDRQDTDEDHVLVLFGQWRHNADGFSETVPRLGATPTSASSIAVDITADPNRIATLMSSIDFSAIASLMK